MADNPAAAITSGTVKIPGVGPVKKVYVYVGVGAVGVAAAYIMWRRQQAAAAADATPADADLGDGLTTPAGSDVYQGATAGSDPTADPDITPMPTTNIEWTQQVLDYFNWLEPGYVTSTVGKYLARIPLSADEADFIRQAWAARGRPPEGPSNFTLTSDGNTSGSTTMPSVPTGLKIGTVTASSISLDWTDSTDAQSYQVFRNGSQVGTPAVSSYTDTGLASGTSYPYTVRAVNGSNVSAASTAVTGKTSTSGTTTSMAVGAITGRKTNWGVERTGVRQTWKAAPNAVKYQIRLDGKIITEVTGLVYEVTGLQPGSHHTVTIVPVGSNGALGKASNSTGYTKK